MAVETTDFRKTGQTDTGRLPSPDIWADCPYHAIRELTNSGPGVGPGGIHLFDDFEDFPLLPGTQTTQITLGRYKVFNTGAGTVIPVSTVNSVEIGGGVLKNSVDTDNDSGSIAGNPSFMLTGTNTASGKLWFEARICFSPITTNGLGFFIGLAETDQMTLATAVPLNAGDPITNTWSGIGFRKPEDNTTTLDTVYTDRATSFTAVGTAEVTGQAAYTWVKLGFVYDPDRTTDCVRFYQNNVKLASVVSSTTLTGTTNLKANALGVVCAIVADSAGTAGEFYMDWWRCAQLLPTVSPV